LDSRILFFSGNSSNSEGPTVLLNIVEAYIILIFKENVNGQLIALQLIYKDGDITIFNLYELNKGDEAFFKLLVNFILGINDTNLITLGVLIEFLKELH
jgi:hypothetical protein